MGQRADLDGYGEEKNSRPHYNSNPAPYSLQEVAIPAP